MEIVACYFRHTKVEIGETVVISEEKDIKTDKATKLKTGSSNLSIGFYQYKESQMNPKEIIRLQIRTNREYLSDIRKSQEEDLYKLCKSLGGHQWLDWQEDWEKNAAGEVRKVKIRMCEWCRKTEREVLTDWE